MILFLLLLVPMLTFWRLVLLRPLLTLSFSAVDASFSLLLGNHSEGYVTLANSRGDWTVHDPLLSPQPQISAPVEALQCFSLCLPIFWALALAPGFSQRVWRVLGLGTLLLVIVSQLSIVLFVVYQANQYFGIVSAAWAVFLLHLAGYCSVAVVPYAAPLLIFIWLDRNLRAQVFREPIQQIS